jgi:DNA polymerase-3 subunit gamma/tau
VSYQVLARKWRPQQFDEVVGQKGVTLTLRNALASGRLAQSFVFAGARGVGKTTTARILARALNCEKGPTATPCGVCDMCVEIFEGRDLDVLEIDAATHTGVDNVRDVIIDGLAIRPVRDRYKIFIIDEVHQLSNSSFNALLKSMEEPPPHVVFMMATTELHKIPDTILSRAQVYEFRTISTRGIIDQLRKIADAEKIEVTDEALALVARAAEGSMRDAESAFDQVLAFGGDRIDVEHVSTVLGLIGRDLLLDIAETVAREDAAAVFDLAARVVESGQDLKHVCRDLARLVRDMMILQIDPARTQDPEYAVEGDRARLDALAAQFSREDLLRAFELIAKLETDLRTATQPRYHLEMALLRWIHLRRLVPLTELIGGTPLPTDRPAAAAARPATPAAASRPSSAATFASATASLVSKVEARKTAPTPPPASAVPPAPAPTPPAPAPAGRSANEEKAEKLREALTAQTQTTPAPPEAAAGHSGTGEKVEKLREALTAQTQTTPAPPEAAAGHSGTGGKAEKLREALTAQAQTTPAPPEAAAASGRSATSAPQAPTGQKAEKPREAPTVQAQTAAPAPSGTSGTIGVFAAGFSEAVIPTFREAFLAEAKRSKGKLFYNTIVMSAKRIDITDGRVTFVFGQRPATLAGQFEQQRASLQDIATSIAGRSMLIDAIEERDAAPAAAAQSSSAAPSTQDRLKASVMNEPAVQAMLDVFPAEIRDVEEM